MPAYFLKTVLATAFLAAATVSFLSMMALMGKPEKKTDPAKLRKVHRISGIVALVLLVPLVYLGARFVGQAGDALSVRGVFHAALGAALAVVLGLKTLIVLVYRNFLKSAPALGMTVFALAFGAYILSAGFTVVMNLF